MERDKQLRVKFQGKEYPSRVKKSLRKSN